MKAKVKDLGTDFQLKRVEIQADWDAKIATAEAEYQKKLMSLFIRPGMQFDEETIKRLKTEGKAYADELLA